VPTHPDDVQALSQDEIFALLVAPRRRAVLRILQRAGGKATFGHIINEVVAHEHGTDGDANKRKSAYVSLYQTHVPRLAEAGVVEYDEASKTVGLTGPWRQLVAYLDFDPPAGKPGLWSRVFRQKARE
jgi:predicted transcriptional regulator